jgi:putative IMPACT (imprinted ancient) family translation regulator
MSINKIGENTFTAITLYATRSFDGNEWNVKELFEAMTAINNQVLIERGFLVEKKND